MPAGRSSSAADHAANWSATLFPVRFLLVPGGEGQVGHDPIVGAAAVEPAAQRQPAVCLRGGRVCVENLGDRFCREHIDNLVNFDNVDTFDPGAIQPEIFRPGVSFYFGAEARY